MKPEQMIQAQQAFSIYPAIKKAMQAVNSSRESKSLPNITASFYISGPKSARIKENIFTVAPSYGVEVTFTDADTRWFTRTDYFNIIGKQDNVHNFIKALKKAFDL